MTQLLPRASTLAAASALAALLTGAAHAQPSASPGEIAARVNGKPIYTSEVAEQLALALRGREAQPEAQRVLTAQAIEQLIGRKLILEMLAQRKLAANDAEIDLEIDRIRKRLAVTGATLEEHLQATGQTIAALRQTLLWQLSWQRYLDRYLNEDNLKRFYEDRRREFDGSEVRVAHILWKVADPDDEEAVAQSQQQAAAVRAAIVGGEISFDAAAAQHSQSPTAASGGKLGFITRHDAMPEPFAKAAFALAEGGVSPPVVTPFGVHVIQCLEIRAGQRPWHDTRELVRQEAMRFLFDWIVSKERPAARVEYTDALPHFEPGTRRLTPAQ
ncbi:MAG: peptidylprolyl isomerase [Planctomycetales bacterium]|nr:peptidylprolyl isomerase [Planctomycetales bacterium]